MASMQKITPNLWFDTEAEEAANFYISIFDDSRIVNVSHYLEAGPRPAGTVLTVTFQLEGQEFTALNGGPQFKFNEAISLLVNCESQAEVDELWEKLSAGGEDALRLAEGQVRRLVADRPHRLRRDDTRRGHRGGEPRHGGNAADGQDRHRCPRAGLRGVIGPCS
jgi:predicted 3-demethylubiquinone-9 3-methyltransferase (glyoxalase superfamily)